MSEDKVKLISGLHDRSTIRSSLAENGFVVIHDFLESGIAEQILHCLENEVSWELAYMNGPRAEVQTTEQLKAMSAEMRQTFHEQVIGQAREAYQFAYFRYPMLDALLNNWSPKLLLNDILELANDGPSLDFFRAVTGDEEIRKVELQATYYAPSHFLKRHNDKASTGDDRRFACVVGFTKQWEADWGGMLQLVKDNEVTQCFTPGFNRCVLFEVPRDHQVSYVAPYATAPRYSLTGWLRAD